MLDILIKDLCSEILSYLDLRSTYNLSRVNKRYHNLTSGRLEYHKEDMELYINEAMDYMYVTADFHALEIRGPSYIEALDVVMNLIPYSSEKHEHALELAKSDTITLDIPDVYEQLSPNFCIVIYYVYNSYGLGVATMGVMYHSRTVNTVSFYNLLHSPGPIEVNILRNVLRVCYLKGYRLISYYKRPLIHKHISIA